MMRHMLCVLLLALPACSPPPAVSTEAVQAQGAGSGHSFSYETAEGAIERAVLAGVRAAPGEEPRLALADLLTEAGVDLALTETPAGRDRYDRRVVYAAFQASDGQRHLDAHLVSAGWAMVWPREGSPPRDAGLWALEAEARSAGLGAWADGRFTIRDPHPDGLAQVLDSAQIVQGRVVATGEARTGRLYLNFGLNWRTDFTVSLSRSVRDAFVEQVGVDASTLDGAVIRVRGWLVEENGPMIRVYQPEQIEILDAPDPVTLRDR